MEVNTEEIDFEAFDQNGTSHKLSGYLGNWVVLYFYPKDDTPGCIKEACSFRDSLSELKQAGVEILGISKDNVESHKKFAEKYHLNFPILADPDKKIIQNYNVTSRTTFLIDPRGMIKKIYERVNPLIHTGQIITDLKTLRSKQ